MPEELLSETVRRFELHYLTRNPAPPELIALKSLEEKCLFLNTAPEPSHLSKSINSCKSKLTSFAKSLQRSVVSGWERVRRPGW